MGDILSTPVCIDILEWSCAFNLTLVSGTKEGTFEEKLCADFPILVFIVPEVQSISPNLLNQGEVDTPPGEFRWCTSPFITFLFIRVRDPFS